MKNPWQSVPLEDYENHMRLDTVMQLQTMCRMMQEQFYQYPASSVMILGIAGGNGLEHIKPGCFKKVYGVDINADYLEACKKRYQNLQGVFQPVLADLSDKSVSLPQADLLIANLLIEYIGYDHFKRVVQMVKPRNISCAVQVDDGTGFVSDPPYRRAFDGLNRVHHTVTPDELSQSMREIGYTPVLSKELPLPNGKKLIRLDYC